MAGETVCIHEQSGLDVFGVGQCCVDCLGTAERYPSADDKVELDGVTVAGGGPVATALAALARWGRSCAIAGVIGDDAFAPAIRASLAGEGVDVAGLVTRPGATSQFAYIHVEPATGRRTVFWRRPTGEPLRADEVDLGRVRAARALHTDGLFAEASLAAARAARGAGLPVVVDAGTLREGMLDLAREADAFLASERFSRALVGGDDPEETCRRLAELGPRVVGVTLGERGWLALEGGAWLRGEARRVDAVDTTGCGDVFHAGFVHRLLDGRPTVECLRFGAWAAARAATRVGGRAGIPDAVEWEEE